MLFRIDPELKNATEVDPASFAALGYRERYDIQEWIVRTPSLLGEDLLVLTTEFSGFDRTAERLDILALDRDGKLVVVELKRSAVGTAAELQALRYAAYCSTMALQDLAEIHASFLSRSGSGQSVSVEEARARITDFVEQPNFEAVDNRPRIILGAEEFSVELTSTVLWLRTFDVDIKCVRLRPYQVADGLFVETSMLIPLPETKDFQIRRDRKESAQGRSTAAAITIEQFLSNVSDEVRPLIQQLRDWLLALPDVSEGVFKSLLSYRRTADNAWITWIVPTKYELRVAFPPAVGAGSDLYVRKSGDWVMLRVRDGNDLERIKELIPSTLEWLDQD